MTRQVRIWVQPFSPEEIAKTPTEAENGLGATALRNRAFADLAEKLRNAENERENNDEN